MTLDFESTQPPSIGRNPRPDGPLYPHVVVQLTGEDENGFVIIGRVLSALKQEDASPAALEQFVDEAMSGTYDELLQTVMKYVEVR